MLSKATSSTIFWVFGMTRPGIETRFPRPLMNTLLIRPMAWLCITVHIYFDYSYFWIRLAYRYFEYQNKLMTKFTFHFPYPFWLIVFFSYHELYQLADLYKFDMICLYGKDFYKPGALSDILLYYKGEIWFWFLSSFLVTLQRLESPVCLPEQVDN